MGTETVRAERGLLYRWVRATTIGWLLGFALVVILALAWGAIGPEAQFMVGVGMGAGVGYMQSRMMGAWVTPARRWVWASTVGMGIPFVLWDLGAMAGIEPVLSLPPCVLAGGLLVGVLQWRLLRPRLEHASWWIPACTVGWGLPAGMIALGAPGPMAGPLSLLPIAAMFFGGVVLGAVTGKSLVWMSRGSAA